MNLAVSKCVLGSNPGVVTIQASGGTPVASYVGHGAQRVIALSTTAAHSASVRQGSVTEVCQKLL